MGKLKALASKAKPYLLSFEVWARTTLHAIAAGAASAILMHVADPKDFDYYSPAGLLNLKRIAVGGAALAVLHLFIDPPKPKGA